MKKASKFWLIILILISVFCADLSVTYADSDSDVVVSLQIDNPMMKVNGKSFEIDSGRGTKPVIINGRTLVPIRAVVEAFGGSVSWNENSEMVSLSVDGDFIELVINSKNAYLNGKVIGLDVPPAIINDRTMIPLRVVAEGFNLGVAWDDNTDTVYVVRNSFDEAEYKKLMSVLPVYSGKPYAEINGNAPYFKEYEIIPASFEYYSKLDELRRTDVCMASVAEDIMPTEERKSLSSVTPTGWINKEYDFVSGKYLYNRCHLIGFQLTGENANDRNLITGTRYLNVDGMLPFENLVDDYVEDTGNHVMYRVTPVFSGSNLVADGVLMEAYSVEDEGRGVNFCVFCYNVQPNVVIDYKTGENYASYEMVNYDLKEASDDVAITVIYRTPTGKRYHKDAECGGKNSYEVTWYSALEAGLTPCLKCAD